MYGPGVDMVLSEQQFAGGVAQSPQYQLTDHLGTVRGVAQRVGGASSATLVNSVQYDAFGKVTSQSNATNQPHHGFAGRDIEPVGGLTYNRNRYYSTSSGRFISQDPIGFAAGDANLYRYVGNESTMYTDPSGLAKRPPKIPGSLDNNQQLQTHSISPQGYRNKDFSVLDALAAEKSTGFKRSPSQVWHHESFNKRTGQFVMTLVDRSKHDAHHKLYPSGGWAEWMDWAEDIIKNNKTGTLSPSQLEAFQIGFQYRESINDLMPRLANAGYNIRVVEVKNQPAKIQIFKSGELIETIETRLSKGTVARYIKRFTVSAGKKALSAIFIVGAGLTAKGDAFTAMGREAAGADLIEDTIELIVIDGISKPIVQSLDPVEHGRKRGIRQPLDIEVLKEKSRQLEEERAKGWCGWMEGILY
jgi:RHS repeat-associated protein